MPCTPEMAFFLKLQAIVRVRAEGRAVHIHLDPDGAGVDLVADVDIRGQG